MLHQSIHFIPFKNNSWKIKQRTIINNCVKAIFNVEYLTTLDAGQFVQVMVPVMHAQQTRAHCVDLLPQPQCTI